MAQQQPYGACVLQGPAELRARGAPPPRVRVLCFPPAGAGACFFHGWGAALPDWAEVLPVELPGRNTRMRERMPADFHALVRDLAASLDPVASGCGGGMAGPVPYALVGHSFGAWLAFELAHALPCPPLALYVSANRAPHLAAPVHDPDPNGASLAALLPGNEPEFWRRFESRYGCNPELQSAGMRRFVLPTLRADFSCLESYRGPAAGSAAARPLACPLTATGAVGDARYSAAQLRAWGLHAAGRFTERWEAPPVVHAWATPHRFLADAPRPFQAFLADDLARLLEQQEAPAEQAQLSRSGSGSVAAD